MSATVLNPVSGLSGGTLGLKPRTTIIINHLLPEVFEKNPQTGLSIADEVKLLVMNYNSSVTNEISHFSNLPSWQRIVIVLKHEQIAREICLLVKEKYAYLNVQLSQTLIRQNSRSHLNIAGQFCDGNITNNGDNGVQTDEFIAKYEEPLPSQNPASQPQGTKTQMLLKSMDLKLDTAIVTRDLPSASPVSPSITLNSYEL